MRSKIDKFNEFKRNVQKNNVVNKHLYQTHMTDPKVVAEKASKITQTNSK